MAVQTFSPRIQVSNVVPWVSSVPLPEPSPMAAWLSPELSWDCHLLRLDQHLPSDYMLPSMVSPCPDPWPPEMATLGFQGQRLWLCCWQ